MPASSGGSQLFGLNGISLLSSTFFSGSGTVVAFFTVSRETPANGARSAGLKSVSAPYFALSDYLINSA